MIRWPFGCKAPAAPAARGRHRPYASDDADRFYNLLFCDDLETARRGPEPLSGAWRVLLGAPPRSSALQTIVGADGTDSRVRALAAHLLRERGVAVVRRCALGVIVEVALPQGLELLAAYADGAVRHLDPDGLAVVFDGAPRASQALAREMVAHGDSYSQHREPWLRPRLPPPRRGDLRISVLASDGLRFVEGSFAALQADADIAAIVGRASRLLRHLRAGTRR